MLKRCLTPLFAGAVMGAAVILSGTGAAIADDTWDPIGSYDLYVRNNSLSTFTATITNAKSATNCSTSEYSYPSGTSVTLAPASMTKILDTNTSDCRGLDTAWKITLQQSGSSTSKTNYFSSGSFYDTQYLSVEGSLSYTVGSEVLSYYSRTSFAGSGAYITIGPDYFGKLGPSVTSEYSNTLTVTSFNTFLGRDDKPEACTRGPGFGYRPSEYLPHRCYLQGWNPCASNDYHQRLRYGPDADRHIW
jgi:hypothetical protein